jgi:hypothetical protein
MAALSNDFVASYRDHRVAAGKVNNTVPIELPVLSNFQEPPLTKNVREILGSTKVEPVASLIFPRNP